MAEPNSTGLTVGLSAAFGTAALSSLLGSAIAPWVLVVVGGALGAAARAAESDAPARQRLGSFIAGFSLALLFTGLIATLAANHFGAEAEVMLMPIAGLIAWQHTLLTGFLKWAFSRRTGYPADKAPP